MRRSITATLMALALVAVAAGSVSAAKPARGCADDFEAWNYLEFADYIRSDAFVASLPPEGQALAPEIIPSIGSEGWIAASESYDKNGDMTLCVKQMPPVKGNRYGWVFNAVDNTANH